ncbi:MAG: M20/M25/M40 family metallo-hydrolase [Betaproteobacteria bacterium]|nr:M20/M25/M40 family metallo-hydrolase [Betaproteobacteria bacterium]MBI3937908.1 M20/M25/M40 family metallo-hydrolase [Betaproteobacteria bacterium]
MSAVLEQKQVEQVLSQIDEKELVDLACRLVAIPSPTGYERKVGEFVADWFDGIGLKTIRQYIGAERMNVVGIVKGSGGGVSLSYNGHMDVPYSAGEDDLLYMSKEVFDRPAHKLNAFVRDGYVYGCGIGNMKANLAATMIAMKAVKQSGVPLRGDLLATIVCGEIGRTPVGRYQGLEYEGAGYGARYAVTHGAHSDYAICVDNSGLKLTWVQPGIVYLRVTAYGLAGGAWATGAAAGKHASQNAIIKMQPVIDAIDDWSRTYPDRYTYKCEGGTVRPTASITSIEGGAAFKASMRPGVCTVTMIVMIAPGTQPLTIVREIQDAVRASHVDAEVEMHQAHLGFEAKGVDGLVGVTRDAFERLFKTKLEICDSPYCSVWTDTNSYIQNGIPCIKLGLGLSAEERLKVGIDAYDCHPIATMVKGAQLYSVLAFEICNRAKL